MSSVNFELSKSYNFAKILWLLWLIVKTPSGSDGVVGDLKKGVLELLLKVFPALLLKRPSQHFGVNKESTTDLDQASGIETNEEALAGNPSNSKTLVCCMESNLSASVLRCAEGALRCAEGRFEERLSCGCG